MIHPKRWHASCRRGAPRVALRLLMPQQGGYRGLPVVQEAVTMTVSMRVMSAGEGYKYLLRTVAAGDGDRSLSTTFPRYYGEEGQPSGRWGVEGFEGIAPVQS